MLQSLPGIGELQGSEGGYNYGVVPSFSSAWFASLLLVLVFLLQRKRFDSGGSTPSPPFFLRQNE